MSVSKYKELGSVEKWLGSVAYSNSGSIETEQRYRRDFNRFLSFIDKTADEFLAEYKALKSWNDFRLFGDRIADYIKAWVIALNRSGLANSTIKNMIVPIQSFFKYNRIDLGFIPIAKDYVEYHNRDIKREEIAAIMNVSLPRDRAFYAVSAQSGLRPTTICKLQIKHVEYNRLLREESPVKIDVPQAMAKGKYQTYFTFISDEAIRHLKNYLKQKTGNLTEESYLFVKQGTENEPMKPAAFSAQFNKIVRKLREKGILDFEVRKNKPSEIRLYCLRKFFKKYTYQVGEEFSEFWMGHKCKGVFDNYRARDPEHHRKLYAEKAMPFLRFEIATPTEIDKIMVEQNKKMISLQKQVEDLKMKLEVTALTRRQMEKIAEGLKTWQEEKRELDAKLIGMVEMQKKMLELPDEQLVEIFRDTRRILKQREKQQKQKAETNHDRRKAANPDLFDEQ